MLLSFLLAFLFVYGNELSELIRFAGFKSNLVGYFLFSFSHFRISNSFQAAFFLFGFVFCFSF